MYTQIKTSQINRSLCKGGVVMATPTKTAAVNWKSLLAIFFNPGEALKEKAVGLAWPVAIVIPGISFALFFLQTGLDLYRTGRMNVWLVVLLAFMGLLYGTVGIMGLAALVWLLTFAGKREVGIGRAISSFAAGYAATLIYSLLGIIFSAILGWRTSVAFGVTGVLWAFRPNMATIKHMTGGKKIYSLFLTTLCGVILLLGWSLLGKINV
jgi:hypothetical protein